VETTLQQRWRLAEATAQGLEGWQPQDEPTCVLEAAHAVALGREAEPGICWSWRQGDALFQAQLTVQDLIEAVDYDEMLTPPVEPSADDWLGLLRLSVYEPHGSPPGAPLGHRWVLDYLP
jgi:hypothetical protein